MRILIAILAVTAVLLQWRFWLGDGGVRELNQGREAVSVLSKELARQQDVNTALRAEVTDLADGVGEIEERARSELGMIGGDETFYQFVGSRSDEPSNNLARSEGIVPEADITPVQ